MEFSDGARHGRILAGKVFLAALAALIGLAGNVGGGLSSAAAAPPEILWEVCPTGNGGGECEIPRGLAADSDTGHIFIADSINRRIIELTAWGEFAKAWGWGVDTGAAALQVCTEASGCQGGLTGSGAGQFGSPQGLALDSAGNVYVVDRGLPSNQRVQKFDPAGNFALMFGGDVNRTKVEAGGASEEEENLCPFDPGDECQQGSEGTGKGQFGAWPVLGAWIVIDTAGSESLSDDTVFVGDQERIQEFDTSGHYLGEIALPVGETVQSLALDPAGNFYLAYATDPSSGNSKADVRKITPAGASGSPASFPVPNPRAVAVDVAGDVYAFDRNNTEILRFDSGGSKKEKFGEDLNGGTTGLVTNICAGDTPPGNLYVANGTAAPSFVRAYGGGPKECEEPPLAAPEIEAQYAVSAGTDAALVRAHINPHFWEDATYFVEYGIGECAAGGCSERAPLEDPPLDGGLTQKPVVTAGVSLAGLEPGTTYHFRFVAESAGGGPEFGRRPKGAEGVDGEATFAAGLQDSFTTQLPSAPLKLDCPNQTFRAGPSAFLPDCRAFEMVSPIDKNGNGIETFNAQGFAGAKAALDRSSADGDSVTYSAWVAFGDALGSTWSSQYISSRGFKGWSTHSVNAPHEGYPTLERVLLDTEYKAFSEDLSQAWMIHDADPPLDPPCSPVNTPVLYVRDNTTESYEALHCEPNEKGFKSTETIELLGVSADGCRTVFRSTAKLTPDAEPPAPTFAERFFQIYESSCKAPPAQEGPLRHIGVLPTGKNCKVESTVGFSPGGEGDGRSKSVWNAFSKDGHRLYWSCGSTLYLRADPNLVAEGEEEVVKISGPNSNPPRFQTASPDGARMLFIASIVGDYCLQAFEPGAEPQTTTIACGLEGALSGEPIDLLGASEDATRVYFVSQAVLTNVPNSEGAQAVKGAHNLYLHERGIGFRFIGVLSADKDVALATAATTPSAVSKWRLRRAARVSPNGLHAAFISTAPLTGFDNTDVSSSEPDAEVFVYDATADGGAGKIVCASCNPTGVRPSGKNVAQTSEGSPSSLTAAAWIPGWQNQLYQGQALSENGRRLFFNSFEALAVRDTNNRQDVYQWEQVDGTGVAGEDECEQIGAELFNEDAGGCISLISSGQDPEDSEFIDADKDGSDVFIRTAESLLDQDPGLVDIYDARIDGGFPGEAPPPPPCEGEACQSPPPPPVLDKPASLGTGPGNAVSPRPKPCPKGKRKVRRNGRVRCVRRNGKGDKKTRRARSGQREAAR